MSNEPYLSVVATTRNDNHGGSLTRRMQIFVNGWIEQCRRHALRSELILVEWNPPADREPLADVLSWPSDTGPCEVRVVTVPEEIHRRFRHAESLPLFQMIAKNVGIRRARAPFVLSTNIDILFNDELMSFLASRRLEKGRLYRIDRHDATAEVPFPATVTPQLEFSRDHLLRVNAREGTFPVEAANTVLPGGGAGTGIRFGDGFGLERAESGAPFHTAGSEAVLTVAPQSPEHRVLRLLIECGPNPRREPLELRFSDETGRAVASLTLRGRERVFVQLPDVPTSELTLRLSVTARGGRRWSPRSLIIRILEWGWASAEELRHENVAVSAGPLAVPIRDVQAPEREITLLDGWGERSWTQDGEMYRRVCDGAVFTMDVPEAQPGRFVLDVGPDEAGSKVEVEAIAGATSVVRRVVGAREHIVIPIPRAARAQRAKFSLRVCRAPVAGRAATPGGMRVYGLRLLGLRALLRALRKRLAPPRVDYLHTNACGDFTLMHRDHWFRLRGYPEWEAYSMNIDGFTCYAAHSDGLQETVLREPKRIYHIEHSLGWSPKAERELYRRITSKGITWIAKEQVLEHARRMYREGPIISNEDDWGLAGVAFAETSPAPALTSVESDKEQDGDKAGRATPAAAAASDRRKD